MSEAKSEILALIFVDIPLLGTIREQEGEEVARECLDHGNRLLREVVEKHGGRLVRSVGGTILCAFPEADAAVESAVQIQRTIAEAEFRTRKHPELRMGVHMGNVRIKKGAHTGEAVTTAARLVTMAKAGQILVTEEVWKKNSAAGRELLLPMPDAEALEKRLQFRLFLASWKAVDPGEEATGEKMEEEDGPQGKRVKRQTSPVRVRPATQVEFADDSSPDDEDISVNPTAKQKTAHHERPPKGSARTKQTKEKAVKRRKIILREVREQRAKTEVPAPEAKASAGPGKPKARLCLIWRENVMVVDVAKPSLTIGRDDTNDIALGVSTASRRHAEIRLREGEYYLIDRSSNGTFVYDEKGDEYYVEHAEVKLGTCGAICPGCPQEEAGAEAILFWLAESDGSG